MSNLRIELTIIYFVVGSIALMAIAFFIYFYDLNIRPVSGRHSLLGQVGRAKQDIPKGKLGRIYVFGEYWNAICDEDLKMGEAVRVIEVHDKFLKVVPSDQLPDTI